MRRRPLLLSATAAVALTAPLVLLAPQAGAESAAGPDDFTEPYGPFGFTTQGLGESPNYAEPSLAIAPDGRHVVACTPGGGGIQYWYSSNNGKTWGTTATSPQNGGGDCEIDFLPDGSLLSADLRITDSYIHRSTDFGKTWDPIGPAGIEQDRQWLAHSPDGKEAYLVYHDLVVEAEFYAKSTDGGKTWSPTNAAIPVTSPDQVTAPGIAKTQKSGDPSSLLDQGVNTFSGPMLVDNNGKDMYVVYSISDLQSNINPNAGVPPFGGTRGLVVAHSGDGGSTWTNHYAVTVPKKLNGAQEWQTATLFPWGSIDAKGTVYVVFNSTKNAPGDHFHQYYTYSKDKARSWSKPVKLDTLPLGKGATAYATSSGGAPGVLDVAWYQSDNGTPSNDESVWVPHFAQVVNADTDHPQVQTQAVTTIPNHKGGICLQGILCGIGPGSGDRSLLDYFEVVVNPRTGMAGIAYADNNRLGVDAEGNKIGEVVYAAQTKGRSALTPTEPPRTPDEGPPHRQPDEDSGPDLAATGLAPALGGSALLLLAAAVLLRRRVHRQP